jgi:LPS-assembly lipoprotein
MAARVPASPSSRRGFVQRCAAGAALGVAALSLAGCGFELRKAPDFAFRNIAVPGNSAYQSQLRRALKVNGAQVLTDEQLKVGEEADVIFEVLNEVRDRAILSTTSSGQIRELRLRLRISFKLRTPQGKDVLAAQDMTQGRDITFNETAALAKENEEQLLYRDMTADLVQQTIRRLAAVKSL